MNDEARFIRENVMAHNKWFEECIPMIASENLMSPLAKEMLISDFAVKSLTKIKNMRTSIMSNFFTSSS